MLTKTRIFMSEQENTALTTLLSPKRLSSYENIDEHFDNLVLIGKITPKLALIEIALRNLMDMLLKQDDERWLLDSEDEYICELKAEIASRIRVANPTHEQFLSNFTLGKNIALIKKFKLQNKIFNFQRLNFRDFYDSNKNFYKSKRRNKIKFKNFHKANIVLDLLSNIRNRSFHWENLLKIVQKADKLTPRLSINTQNTIISIYPQKIEVFLDYILNSLDKGLLRKLNERVGEK